MADNTIAKAYVQLVASADGIKDSVSKEMGAAGENGGKKFSEGFGKFLKGAGAAVGTAVGAATTAVGALTKQSISAYADFEQLTGGVETLFGAGGQSIVEYADSMGESIQNVAAEYSQMMKAQNDVMGNASNAFKTAGLSANEYMETVTGFSASLIQSLGGDTSKAAEVADMAIIDMSDNANKMGTSMESIQNAYQGFAKQNYTMLDNLKLGYGGTKEEMSRLLRDATAISGVEYNINSFSDIAEAIHVIQTNLDITGTTSKEASSTISGSIGQMQASWANLVAGIANPDADLSVLIDDFVSSTLTMVDNIAPALKNALSGIGQLVEGLAPIVAEQLPGIITGLLPSLISAVQVLLDGVVSALPTLMPFVSQMALSLVNSLCQFLTSNLPELLVVAMQAIVTLAKGLGQALPTLVPQLVNTIIYMAETLTDPQNLGAILEAALAIIEGLANGIISALPQLVNAVPVIVSNLIATLVKFIPQLIYTGQMLFLSLVDNMPLIIGGIISTLPNIINGIIKYFREHGREFVQMGVDLMLGLAKGIGQSTATVVQNAVAAAKQVLNSVKGFFGIHSPSKAFAEIGQFLDLGMANGITDNLDVVDKAMDEMIDSVNMGADLSATYTGGVAPSAFNIVVNAAEGQNVEAIAEAVSRKIANEYTRERMVFA